MPTVNKLAEQILENKYYAPGESSPTDVFTRVAKVIAIPDVIDRLLEKKYLFHKDSHDVFDPYQDIANRVMTRRNIMVKPHDKHVDVSPDEIKAIWGDEALKYYSAMSNLEFMGATPTLINAGRPTGMLSSCFFLRVPDTMEGIFERVKDVAIISKMGGGVGLDLSELRPAGAAVTNTNGTSSGPISFLKVFNETGNQVQQGGIRRAALMAIMRVDHPDIMTFIRCKEKEGELSNFNLSVLITDEFMTAVKNNSNIKLYHEQYDKTHSVKARQIWDELVKHAWNNGEPGIIFWDTVNRGDVFKNKYGKLGVNPCGEQLLLEYESCSLAAVNLAECYKEKTNEVDLDKLDRLTRLGIRFLDNVIDINIFPLQQIEEWTTKTRRVGLGTMGLHDLMLKLGIRYGTKASLELIDTVYSAMKKSANGASEELGKARGVPQILQDINLTRRNSGLLTAQPTGTIAQICNQASSGVEPVFQWMYTRKDKYGTHDMNHFMLDKFDEDDLPDYAVTALDLQPKDHVIVQAQVQKYIDSSISKTCNLPNNATVDDIDQIYKKAYALGCKSITAYRSGSRQEEVLNATNKEEQVVNSKVEKSPIRERPRVLYGATYRINTPGGKAYITINEDPEGIREVFIHISKAGSEISTHIEAEGRLISNSLKHRIPVEAIIGHLTGHKSNPIIDHGKIIKSVPDAVAQVVSEFKAKLEGFSEFLEESDNVPSIYEEPHTVTGEISGDLCPDCGEVMYRASGCNTCYCGYSQCG